VGGMACLFTDDRTPSMRPLCRDLPSERWDEVFPPNPEALRVCFSCPLIEDCYEAVQSTNRHLRDDVCIWGATTPSQRHRIRIGRLTLEQAWQESRDRLEAHDSEVHQQMFVYAQQQERAA